MQGGFHFQPLSQNGGVMIPQGTGNEQGVALLEICCGNFTIRRAQTDSRRVDIQSPVAFHYLRITGHNFYAGFPGRGRHRSNNLIQGFRFQPRLQNKRRRQIQRSCPHAGQVVYRTAHRQPADIAAGKKQGLHYKTVRGKDRRTLHFRKHRRVFHFI